MEGKRPLSALVALAAVATALGCAVVTLFLATRRSADYCEDVGGPCSDAAPVRVVLLVVLALAALALLAALAWRLLSHAIEPRPHELGRPLVHALVAGLAWLAAAASLLVDAG
jgi:hypothetical protein